MEEEDEEREESRRHSSRFEIIMSDVEMMTMLVDCHRMILLQLWRYSAVLDCIRSALRNIERSGMSSSFKHD